MKPMARIGCAGLTALCLCTGAAKAQPARLMPNPAIDFLGTVVTCSSDDECSNTSFCVLPPTGQPGSGTCYFPRNRYLSIDPNSANAGLMTARRLSVQTDAGPVVLGWMDEPVFGDFGKFTRIVGAPFYRDWTTRDTVELADCHVAPRYTYLIQAIEEGQDTADEANFSESLVLRTVAVWSDVAGPLADGQLSPPNCVLNI